MREGLVLPQLEGLLFAFSPALGFYRDSQQTELQESVQSPFQRDQQQQDYRDSQQTEFQESVQAQFQRGQQHQDISFSVVGASGAWWEISCQQCFLPCVSLIEARFWLHSTFNALP